MFDFYAAAIAILVLIFLDTAIYWIKAIFHKPSSHHARAKANSIKLSSTKNPL